MVRCRLFRFTHPKKLLRFLAVVAVCALFLIWRASSEPWEGAWQLGRFSIAIII